MQRCVELSGEDRASIESDPSWRPDYTALLESDPALADSVVTCELRPGDYMLWDDRMIHGNSAGRGPSPTGANLARAAIFLSMSPMSLLVRPARHFFLPHDHWTSMTLLRVSALRAGSDSGMVVRTG